MACLASLAVMIAGSESGTGCQAPRRWPVQIPDSHAGCVQDSHLVAYSGVAGDDFRAVMQDPPHRFRYSSSTALADASDSLTVTAPGNISSLTAIGAYCDDPNPMRPYPQVLADHGQHAPGTAWRVARPLSEPSCHSPAAWPRAWCSALIRAHSCPSKPPGNGAGRSPNLALGRHDPIVFGLASALAWRVLPRSGCEGGHRGLR